MKCYILIFAAKPTTSTPTSRPGYNRRTQGALASHNLGLIRFRDGWSPCEHMHFLLLTLNVNTILWLNAEDAPRNGFVPGESFLLKQQHPTHKHSNAIALSFFPEKQSEERT